MKGITTFVPGDYWVHLDDVGESPLSACCEHEGLKNNVVLWYPGGEVQ